MLPTFLNLAFFLTLLQQDFVHFMPQVVAIRDNDDLHAAKSSGYFQTSTRSSLYSIWHNHCNCLPFEIISLLCFQDKTHFYFFSYLTPSQHLYMVPYSLPDLWVLVYSKTQAWAASLTYLHATHDSKQSVDFKWNV